MPLENLNIDTKKILIEYEDRYFNYHFGVNPFAIIRAIIFNITNQRVIGASTISMQLARMMYHKPRTLISKISEIFRAFQIEFRYSKDEILKLYLNNAPFGGNIEGVEGASYLYFNLPLNSLSIAQISYLISIPKNPNKNSPKNIKRVNRLKDIVLKRVENIYNQDIIQRALKEQIKPKRDKLPNLIPHLSSKIKTSKREYLTIDIKLQKKIEEYLKDDIKNASKYNISNSCAVVIDNKSMEILAYVGSNDFYSKEGGENDGIEAIISSGSTLKPFIYALSLERGLVTPLSNLFDISINLNGYAPQNFSKRFIGKINTSQALQYSINTVAVELDRLLGDNSLYNLLIKADIKSINKPKNYYGSSIALGGSGIKLIELAQLYSSLANGGIYQKASYYQNHKPFKKTRILSPQSTYLISNILSNVPRENLSSSWEFIDGLSKVAFKTGTSAYAKDLLSIGYTPKYTVAVWYGNFNRSKKVKREDKPTGIKVASPTMLKIFKYLNDKSWFKKPQHIITQNICQDIIKIGECKNHIKDEIIEGINYQKPCKILRAETLAKMQKSGLISSMSELKNNRCYDKWKNYKPLITSPINNSKYTNNRLLPKELKKIKLQCYSFETNSTIYWLIDNQLPIKSKSKIAIYKYLEEGKHNIRCLDSGAKMSSVSIDLNEL
ncbi:Penicillin-insensitive transglycosylase & transpeptidase PBP-1C [hydrothermal vent metagenome]|uniref:peptidoglycan glycosyltransferase n=1 Tax=hydrothermal vent metagenome TaxID=652676 RepID=A0A1W1EHT2_9ZZZZ